VVDTDYNTQQGLGALIGGEIHFESCPCEPGKTTLYIDICGSIDDRKESALKAFCLFVRGTTNWQQFEKR
jgi:hypothetical protein